ncbi:MAG: TonB family protein [Deltaproteobacteria bacterium]|nr:TonB family protein [Deltaproteobacteria bacterium]
MSAAREQLVRPAAISPRRLLLASLAISAAVHAAVLGPMISSFGETTYSARPPELVLVELLPDAPAPVPSEPGADEPLITTVSPVPEAPPPPSRSAVAAATGATPVKFGVAPESLNPLPETGAAEAPAGNTLAVPPDTGRDIPPTDALAYSGGGVPTTEPPAFASLSSVTEFPRFLDFAPPRYPEAARRSGHEAIVRIEVDIAPDGSVIAARPAAGEAADPLFVESALRSVRAARFSPARIGTRPVAVRATLPVKFQLRN